MDEFGNIIEAPVANWRVTCRVEGCGNNGVAIVVPAYGDEPTVICGGYLGEGTCGARITDLEVVD